jgi:hypothetical protein
METIMIEIGLTIGAQATKSYMSHREHMINEHREDELISYRVKNFVNKQYIKMSSRDTTPIPNSTTTTDSSSPLDPRIGGVLSSKIKDFLARNITPLKKRSSLIESPDNAEFYEFVRKLMVFIKNESVCQSKNPESKLLLKHKHYRELLLQSLEEQELESMENKEKARENEKEKAKETE